MRRRRLPEMAAWSATAERAAIATAAAATGVAGVRVWALERGGERGNEWKESASRGRREGKRLQN